MFQAKSLIAACFGAVLLASCASAPASEADNTCVMSAEESAWVARSLDAWRWARTEKLRVDDAAPPPTIVFFNETCVFTGEGGAPWRGGEHGGAITLPDGNQTPPQVVSFASPYAENTRVFFTMSLPSIWRAANVQTAFGIENLATAVLIHEMTHTRQFAAYSSRIDAIDRQYSIGDALSDDIVQNTFRDNAAYVAAYEAERDLLYRALAAPTDGEARALAGEALAMMRARSARYFVGENAKLVELEDIFLTMEGIAQWAAYSWQTDANGGGFAPEAAIPGMRRGGRQWSQDEGMAIFLVVDRLVPNWQARAFAAEPATALELLALAAA